MTTGILLMKLTDQGVKNIKEAPKRIEEGIKKFEEMGGKVLGFYTVWGEYDYIAIGEAPSDEIMTTFAIALSAGGNVRTQSLKAFTKEQLAGMVKKLS